MGEEKPDVATKLAVDRTHLANERTFAAWIRTGLSVAAAGIAVAHVAPRDDQLQWAATSLSIMFIVLGSAMIVFGGHRFATVARDLAGTPSPTVYLARGLAYVVMSLLALLVLLTFVLFV
jgi:putative membrane protein